MKTTIQILALLILFTACQSVKEDNLHTFLGEEKAQVIERANNHYSEFLEQNFDGKNDLERTIGFLAYFDTTSDFKPNWTVDLKAARNLISSYENTSLRKDFERYGHEQLDSLFFYDSEQDSFSIAAFSQLEMIELELEEEEVIPVKGSDTTGMKAQLRAMESAQQKRLGSSLFYNLCGRYQFGLKKYFPDDSIVFNYISSKEVVGNIPNYLLAGWLKKELEKHERLTEGTRLIILFELYLPYLRHELRKTAIHEAA